MAIKRPDHPRLQWVKFTRAKGKLYAYFNTGRKVDGKLVYAKMPSWNSPEFFASYASFKGARTKRLTIAPTVASVIEIYQRSGDWTRLADGSRKLYQFTLDKIAADFGDFPLADVTRARVFQAVEKHPGAATRNIYVSVLSVIFKFARVRDLTTIDPCKDIPTYKTGEHEPWPRWLIDRALAADDSTVRLATHLLYFTGQRIGDVCRMRWSDIAGRKIIVRQEKTDKHLSIHQHERLADELAGTVKAGMTILCQPNGKPWSQSAVRTRLQAFAAGEGVKVVPHGLRKNAVIALLEAGCTIPEVQAVTGQSVEMVMHYAAKVDQGALSEAAILKMERKR